MNNQPNAYVELRVIIEEQRSQLKYSPSKLAQTALLNEVYLTPKPGLVDQLNTGSHQDMDLSTFLKSIIAITPYFDQFYCYGLDNAHDSPVLFLQSLRTLGIACENSMFAATQNINTHKGAIFSLGLILAAMGRLQGLKSQYENVNVICGEVATLCKGLVSNELMNNQGTTVGERLYQQYNLTGARGEAQSGYALVRTVALPVYRDCIKQGYSEELSLLQAMLHLFSINNDTNIVARGGIDGLTFVQQTAKQLLYHNGVLALNGRQKLIDFDQQLIKRNLSPGGSADLIAVTWFFSNYA